MRDTADRIRERIGVLYQVSESLAMLDLLCSFAHQCTVADYVRPEFSNTLALKACRHPIRERLQHGIFVPNDVYASFATSFHIVTG